MKIRTLPQDDRDGLHGRLRYDVAIASAINPQP
jgi:hypothetical protein